VVWFSQLGAADVWCGFLGVFSMLFDQVALSVPDSWLGSQLLDVATFMLMLAWLVDHV
jgi:hypothetical protein